MDLSVPFWDLCLAGRWAAITDVGAASFQPQSEIPFRHTAGRDLEIESYPAHGDGKTGAHRAQSTANNNLPATGRPLPLNHSVLKTPAEGGCLRCGWASGEELLVEFAHRPEDFGWARITKDRLLEDVATAYFRASEKAEQSGGDSKRKTWLEKSLKLFSDIEQKTPAVAREI